MRMPTGGFLSNHAHQVCARLAHDLKAWLAQPALPRETMRFEWKRFRRPFVQIVARVIHSGRRTIVRHGSGRQPCPKGSRRTAPCTGVPNRAQASLRDHASSRPGDLREQHGRRLP